jgi:septal ring factor EnvC (AmiA/AmiB activator)
VIFVIGAIFVPLYLSFFPPTGDGSMAVTDSRDDWFKSPVRKLAAFFQKSRDRWKAKHHTLKAKLKKERNQIQAVEKNRARWRSKAETAIRRIEELERELAAIKKQPTPRAVAANGAC